MNNAEASRNLEESGYVLHGGEVESIHGQDLDLEIIENKASQLPSDKVDKLRNFEALRPEEKKALLEDFINLPIEEMLVDLAGKDKSLLNEASRLITSYVEMSGAGSAEEFIDSVDSGVWSNDLFERIAVEGLNIDQIRQDLLAILMSDTIEYNAHLQARNELHQKRRIGDKDILSEVEPIDFIPPIRGYHSGIEGRWENKFHNSPKVYTIGVWDDLIDVVESVDYQSHRKLDKQELTEKVKDIIELSSRYNLKTRPYGTYGVSTFGESLAWAQLSEPTRERLCDIHIYEIISFGPGLAKFIGKTGPNKYEASYRATQRSIENIKSKIQKDPNNELLKNLLRLEEQNFEEIEQKHGSDKNILNKAVDLMLAFSEKDFDFNINFWTNEASLGEINWAHNALRKGVGLESIMKFTVIHRAVEEFGEAQGVHSVTRNLMDLAGNELNRMKHGFVFQAEFERIAKTYNFAREYFPNDDSVYHDLSKILSLSGNFHLDEILAIVKDRKTLGLLAKNEWILRSAESKLVDPDDEFGLEQGYEIDIFPFDKDIKSQYQWILDNAATTMEGIDREAQAKFILHRLRMGSDKNLHDATYWLHELGVKHENIQKRLELETELIESLFITTDQNELAKFPTNQKRLNEMFIEKKYLAFYMRLLELKKRDSSWGTSTEEMLEYSKKFPVIRSLRPVRKFNEVLKDLRAETESAKSYEKDLMKWLWTHGDAPREVLIKAWKSRDLALADGCPDNPRAIINWQETNAIKAAIESQRLNITQEEFEDFKGFFKAIASSVPIDEMDTAFKWYKKRSKEQILPSDIVEPREGYTFEILSKDDPRGFTIGFDTGCCMTVDGMSRSCIRSGYRHEDCGFLALYGPDGKIRAQSYWYINQKYPNVLVLDNIEANEGRDFRSIVELYQISLQNYLATHPELGITEVHVGTGYVDVDLRGLEDAKVIENSHNVYTDATSQKILYEMEV